MTARNLVLGAVACFVLFVVAGDYHGYAALLRMPAGVIPAWWERRGHRLA